MKLNLLLSLAVAIVIVLAVFYSFTNFLKPNFKILPKKQKPIIENESAVESNVVESPLLQVVSIDESCGNNVCDSNEDIFSCPYDCLKNKKILFVAFQLHIEETPGKGKYYDEDKTLFLYWASVLNKLAKKFEEHKAKLSIQTEKNFANACLKFNYNILAELKERGHGIGVQSHMGHHIKDLNLDNDEKRLNYTAEVKKVVEKVVGNVTNLGGGFEMEHVKYLGYCNNCLGFISMSAVDKPYHNQAKKEPRWLHPWIVGDVQMINLASEEWTKEDINGYFVIIPGWYKSKSTFEIDCRADESCNCIKDAINSIMEALKDSEYSKVNAIYVSSHLYQSGGSKEIEERVLNCYSQFFNELEPFVNNSSIVFATFDEIANVYLRYLKAKLKVEGQLS